MGSPNDMQQQPGDVHDTNSTRDGIRNDTDHSKAIQSDNTHPLQLRQWLQQHGNKKLVLLLDAYLHELRLHAATNVTTFDNGDRYKMVQKTLNLIRHMIGVTSWKTPAELLYLIRNMGAEIVRTIGTNQHDPAIENIVRRVMAAIREEAARDDQDSAAGTDAANNTNNGGRLSLQSILWALSPPQQKGNPGTSRYGNIAGTSSTVTQRQESLASEEEMKSVLQTTSSAFHSFPASYYSVRPNFKVSVLEAIQEILTDLEDVHRNINEQVMNYIHSGEVILTCGSSETIELFLKSAHIKIKQQQQSNQPPFSVIVCGDGYNMACSLTKIGIDTTYIENAAVFAVMARVNKVLLPVHAVLANGGLVTQSGGNIVALAANEKSVPVVCVTGLYKLCPLFPHEGQDTLQELLSPVPNLLPTYNEIYDTFDTMELVNPLRDYIEPKLINLFITNVGSFPPSFIYRLLAENYHIEDWKPFG
jgi:translation initiation factor eIF-2B subunit beta